MDAASQSQYSPERSWQFELGGKSSWFNDKLSANAALFYTDAENYQTYRINPVDPTEAYLLNAHRAELYGAELELTARPVQGLDLSAALGYTFAHYNRFTVPGADTGTGAPADLDGFVCNAGDAGFHQRLSQCEIGGQMQVGEKNLAIAQQRAFRFLRLLHLDNELSLIHI